MKLHWRQYGKYYIRIAIALLMLIGVFVASCIGRSLSNQLKEQQLAARWSDTDDFVQISCFFPKEEGIDVSQIPMLEQTIIQAMTDAAIDLDEKGGRSLVDAYSVESSLTVASDRGETTVRAYGVSKDYFLFHPLELLSGTYFSSDDINRDGVILDELVAWQLFGSYEVAGLSVEINGRLYPVRGVVRSNHGLYSKDAGEENASIYVDYELLSDPEYGAPLLDSYELLILNPVDSFGVETLGNTLKDTMAISDEQYEMVDNTNRFSFVNNWKRIGQFGTRSMHSLAIRYPAWENRARAYEDVMSLLEVVKAALLIYPAVILIMAIVFACRQSGKVFSKIKLFFKKTFSKKHKKTKKKASTS